ncbi:MAG: hypothetical protein KF830_02810 [Planctomycetes bacterium]|nr:hypothetical protein [Planctomycetota bacterium]
MATRFELVLDDAGRFHFQLRSPDGDLLLRSVGCDGKIKAQTAVLHARSGLRDPERSKAEADAEGGHWVVVREADGALLARSPRLGDAAAARALLDRIRGLSDTAPIIDLTKRRAENAAS